MWRRKRALLLFAAVCLCLVFTVRHFSDIPALGGAAAPALDKQRRLDNLVADQLSYHLGVLAYLYAYPLVDSYRRMHNETHTTGADQVVYAPLNRLYFSLTDYPVGSAADVRQSGETRSGETRSGETRSGETRSGETRSAATDMDGEVLVASAWLDVGEEPLVLHLPGDVAGQIFLELRDFYGNASMQQVTLGDRARRNVAFSLFAQQFSHPQVTDYWHLSNPYARLTIRYRATPGERAEAIPLQRSIWLTALSTFDPDSQPPVPEPVIASRLDPMGSLGFFEIMNVLLRSQPEPAGTAVLMAQFDAIGVGPNREFRQSALDPAHKRGLERAVRDGRALVEAAAGNPGLSDSRREYDYLARAARAFRRANHSSD